MRLTFRIVGHTLFSTELSGTADEIGPAISVALEHADTPAQARALAGDWWQNRNRDRV